MDLTADSLSDPARRQEMEIKESFARFILDRKLERVLRAQYEAGESVDPATTLRPANPDTFLLISAGVDGRYGTADDVVNFPLSVE